MNKSILIAFLCLIFNTSWAQTERTDILKINPLSGIFETGSVFYEHKIDNKHSWQLGLAYVGYTSTDIQYSGWIVTPEYRIYLHQKALSGIYIGPFLRYQNFNLTNSDNATGNYSSFGGGVVIGHQWVYRKGFVLDLFAGPAYNGGKTKYYNGLATFSGPGFGIDGVGLRAGLSLGFGF